MSVTVFTRSGCGACVGTKELMTRLGIEFTEVNAEEDLEVAQQLVDEGFRAMPVVKVDGQEPWAGMKKDRILALQG